jgi:DNA-binding transcriptional LysR family regulator
MRALEASVRLGSFTAAADHLALSQGAISQQIKALEDQLGSPLFHRSSTGVEPTPLALTLALQIRQGLGLLDRAFDRPLAQRAKGQTSDERKHLVLSVLPAFAARWLLRRITSFSERHPHIDLEIQPMGTLARMDASDGVDAAIRYGPGAWPGLEAEKLMNETVFPVVSPAYDKGRLPSTPRDLRDCFLLRHAAQPWEPWFQAAGVGLTEPHRSPKFADAGLVIEAAIDGRGVALARRALVQDDIDAGRLVRLWSHEIVDVHAYFLVWPQGTGRAAQVNEFRIWLRDEVASWRRQFGRAEND